MVKIRSMTKNAKTSLKNRRTYRKRVSVTMSRKSRNTTVKNIFSVIMCHYVSLCVIMYLTYYPLFNNYTIIYII